MLEFRATGAAGFLPALLNDPGTIRVQKRASRVNVRFASQTESIATREGAVPAAAGDAILTSETGEQWPMRPDVFERRYRAAAWPDEFVSVPQESRALRMHEAFELVFADGVTRLAGQPGDWLLDYGDGHLGIVGADIFAATYERLD